MKQLLTDKCKKDFEEWHLEQEKKGKERMATDKILMLFFESLTPSMQWGAIQDFFDSVNIYIGVGHNEVARKFYFDISTKPMSDDIGSNHNLTRKQARKQAVKRANQLYNNK